MTVKLGINPLTWTNDDLPSLGEETSLETCLSEARQAGFTGVELGNKFPRVAAQLRPILKAHDLHLVSGWYSGRLLERSVDQEWDAMSGHFELLKSMGCDVMVFAEVSRCSHGDQRTPVSQRPHLAHHEWPVFCDKLTTLADRMEAEGLRLAYHHHMGTVVQSHRDVQMMMAGTGESVGLLFDTGHLTYAGVGASLVTMAEQYAKRIVHVHCKDVRASILERVVNRDSSFLNAVLDGVFTVPGDGLVDYRRVLAPLAQVGYSGWLIVEAEQDPVVAPSFEYANKGFSHLNLLAKSLFN
jgi:inosose dehydratase